MVECDMSVICNVSMQQNVIDSIWNIYVCTNVWIEEDTYGRIFKIY